MKNYVLSKTKASLFNLTTLCNVNCSLGLNFVSLALIFCLPNELWVGKSNSKVLNHMFPSTIQHSQPRFVIFLSRTKNLSQNPLSHLINSIHCIRVEIAKKYNQTACQLSLSIQFNWQDHLWVLSNGPNQLTHSKTMMGTP